MPTIMDNHHYGEKFATFWLHNEYGMKFYTDLMLVHGYEDIIPSWFANTFLGGLNYKNECLANFIVTIAFLFTNIILALKLFKKNLFTVYIASGLFSYFLNINALFPSTIILGYMLLIEKIKTDKNILWHFGFFTLALIALSYRTTLGTAFTIAALPILFLKIKSRPVSSTAFWAIALSTTFYIFGDQILSYIDKAQYYINANLYSFGNFFPDFKHTIASYKNFYTSLIPLILFPTFFNLAIITKNKKIKYTCIFSCILTLVILNYGLGRIDQDPSLARLRIATSAILTVIIPYMLFKYSKNKLFIYNCIICICLILNTFFDNKTSIKRKFFTKPTSAIDFISQNTIKTDTILDLNNTGMIYYFAKRKAAMPYVSFYNIVNSKQTEAALEELSKNPPKTIILMHDEHMWFDKIGVSERINKIYKWIFESGLYKLIIDRKNIYLVYSPKTYPNKIPVTIELDTISSKSLGYLPDVWGASIKTLPLAKVISTIELSSNNKIYEIKLTSTESKPDLLYIKYEPADINVNFEITLNNSKSILNFISSENEILIPIDHYPTWLLQPEIKNIQIKTSLPINIEEIYCYKRN